MESFTHWLYLFPIATVSTILFYGLVLAALFHTRYRRWLAARLVTPFPSTYAYSGVLDSYRGMAAVLVAFAHMTFWCYPLFWASKDCFPYLISYGGIKQFLYL